MVSPKRIFIDRLNFQDDLLLGLTDVCRKNNVTLGVFNAIGAVNKASLGYYDQLEKKYVETLNIDKKLEIASCSGNISLSGDNEIFVHAHVVFAGHDGRCYGGHLMPGASVFACEYHITEFEGIVLKRRKDSNTGLNLW